MQHRTKNDRDASASFNGYFYQRLSATLLILQSAPGGKNYTLTKIVEEGYEDVDIIEGNKRKIYQYKYNASGETESLTNGKKKSGMYKVILGNYNKHDIDEINMCVYSPNDPFSKIHTYFTTKNF